MPTIGVNKADLFEALGKEYTTEEFDELCFEFGIELDEDTTNTKRPIVDGVEEPPQLKIEIPANRYVAVLEFQEATFWDFVESLYKDPIVVGCMLNPLLGMTCFASRA